jgi:hypothetical protein
VRRESHEEVTTEFTHPKENDEIEDKGRLPVELAAQIVRQLDAGMRMEVPGWGRYAIRPLGVSRIIDRYYDTPDRMFQTWSKAHGKPLLLRDRHEGNIVGDVDFRNIQTQADIVRLLVEDETHKWVAKVPLKMTNAHSRLREARENEAPYTDQDREAVRAELLAKIRQTLGLELDSTTVDVRECVGKVRKTYGVFSQPASHAPERHIATIHLDFIVREYYKPGGVSVERYAKYEAEKQGRTTARQFAACTQALRAVLHIPKEEPPPLILTSSPGQSNEQRA